MNQVLDRVAIDIDGTISAYPEHFSELIGVLSDTCVKIYALTGSLDTARDNHEQTRRDQLSELGMYLGWFNGVQVCVAETPEAVAELKGEFCRDNAIGLFIDDSDLFLNAVKRLSPDTLCLKVWEGER